MGKVAAGSELHRDVILLSQRRQPGVGRSGWISQRGRHLSQPVPEEQKRRFLPFWHRKWFEVYHTVDELARLIRPPCIGS